MSQLIPQSKARTAYGLLSDVIKVILDEPKRYNQETTLRTHQCVSTPRGLPECGTVGCVAGWTCVLSTEDMQRPGLQFLGVMSRAAQILGLNAWQEDELFNASAIDRLDREADIQTERYAQLGAKHIRNFQKKYSTQLRAHKLKGAR